MADSSGAVAAQSWAGRALNAMASAIRCALDARQVLIAVQDGHAWTVRGTAASHSPVDSSPARLRGLSSTSRLDVQTPVIIVRRGREWQVTEASSSSPASDLAVVMVDAREVPVMLLARAADAQRVQTHMKELLGCAVDAVRAEDDVHRQVLQDSTRERENERRRWARELHDDTLQQLGAMQVLLTSARQHPDSTSERPPPHLSTALNQAVELVSRQIVSLRHLISELRPAALDELGLRSPLEALADRTERLTGMRVDMRVSLPYSDGLVSTRLLPDVELAVYRVVQEALANAARHSQGTAVRVLVEEVGDQVRVEVSDNGAGPANLSGFGIDGMRERAALAGGWLDVAPPAADRDARGTTVRMVVPAMHRHAASSDEGDKSDH